MKRFCIIWLVLMLLLWFGSQFVQVKGRCVVGNRTLCFAFDHGGLWFLHGGPDYGPATLEFNTNWTDAATLAPPSLGWNMWTFPGEQWGVIPYWLVAVPAVFGLWWQRYKRTRRPPRGFAM